MIADDIEMYHDKGGSSGRSPAMARSMTGYERKGDGPERLARVFSFADEKMD